MEKMNIVTILCILLAFSCGLLLGLLIKFKAPWTMYTKTHRAIEDLAYKIVRLTESVEIDTMNRSMKGGK
jgi:hypothetical protein